MHGLGFGALVLGLREREKGEGQMRDLETEGLKDGRAGEIEIVLWLRKLKLRLTISHF